MRESADLDSLLTASKELYARPYWNHLWILQEIILSQDAEIWCARTTIDLESLSDITCAVFTVGPETVDVLDYRSRWMPNHIHRLQKEQEQHKGLHPRFGAGFDKCPLLADGECSDNRDRIYGTLQIIPWSKHLHAIVPDYRS